MKNILYTILALSISGMASGQVDRSKIPGPGPAREIKIGDYESFTLKNGLKVFVVENHKLPRVSFSIVLDRQPVMEGEKAGYLGMVGQMLRRGTTTKTKDQIDEEIDFIGASLFASATSIFGSSLTKHKDKMLSIMTDILFNPIFPEDELEKIKTQTLSGLAANKDDPEAISSNVSTVLVYGKDHPYGELTTEETVKNITVDDIKQYYQTYFKPNIAYMAIVGDIKKKEAQKLVKSLFGKWESAEVPVPTYSIPAPPDETYVALVEKSSAVQSVVDITYPVILKPGTPDVVKARVLNQVLGGSSTARLFMNLREDKGYTYGAYSSLSPDRLVGQFSASASVRNDVTDSALVQFNVELNTIKNELVTQEELELAKSSISGSFARSLERPQTIANFAINTARYNLPKDYYNTYLQKIQAVTVADVQETANKFIHSDHAYITIVGKANDIADKLAAFGDVKYYDIYGNEYIPSDSPAIPEGLTPADVMGKYIEAIGGKDKIGDIENIKVERSASIQGQNLKIISVNKAPNLSYTGYLLNGTMEMQKSVFDGKESAQYQQGQRVPDDGSETKDAPISSLKFPELQYESLGATLVLKGIEKVNDENTYVIDITMPSGKKLTEYFSIESGLKLRQTNYVKGPQGEMVMNVDYKDYTEYDGIKLPNKVIIPLGGGPMKMEANIDSVEINKGVDESLFVIN